MRKIIAAGVASVMLAGVASAADPGFFFPGGARQDSVFHAPGTTMDGKTVSQWGAQIDANATAASTANAGVSTNETAISAEATRAKAAESTNATAAAAAQTTANTAVTNAATAQTTANAAIPLTQKGAASGVAPLDANSLMSAGVSGSVSAATATATYSGSVARSVASKWSDVVNLKDLGLLLSSSSASADALLIPNILENNTGTSQVVEVPAGTWPSSSVIPTSVGDTDFVNVLGRLDSYPVFIVADHNIGLGVPYFGDCVLSETHNSMTGERLNFARVDSNSSDACEYRSSIGVTLVSDTPNQQGSDTNSGNKNITITHVTTPQYHGYGENLSVKGFHLSLAGSGAQDVDDYVRSMVYGNEWVWAHNTEYNHMIPFSSGDGPYSPEWVYDDSAAGVGRDVAASAYDPSASYRKFHWITLNTHVNNDSNTNVDLKWNASTGYHAGQMIIVPNVGDDTMFLNTSGEATTGSTEPAWPTTTGDTVVDGGITWKNMGEYTFDYGCIFCVAGGTDGGHNVRAGTLMATWGLQIYNSIQDFSEASWEPSLSTHVFTRTQPETYIDLSADGTQAGQNNHLFGYSKSNSGLLYVVNGSLVSKIGDDGEFYVQQKIAGIAGSVQFQNDVQAATNLSVGGSFKANGPSSFGGSVSLSAITKANLLALESPTEGMKFFDTDDHAEVTYRCPTTTTCGWFPTQYGTALSN